MPQRHHFIGCAGWSIPADARSHFPEAGSLLERYAQIFTAVEINSSFYRPHRASTYSRWASSVPEGFRFSVKVPKAITHTARLKNAESPFRQFHEECSHLGDKLGCLLVQLPPGLQCDTQVAAHFFRGLRETTNVDVVCEPRHPSWATDETSALLAEYRVGRVIADPNPIPVNPAETALGSLRYFRLHGSPQMYYSSYTPAYLEELASQLRKKPANSQSCWCIFDNTAAGAATRNALELLEILTPEASGVTFPS